MGRSRVIRTKPKETHSQMEVCFLDLDKIKKIKKSRAAFSNIKVNNRPLSLYWDNLNPNSL